MHDLDIFNNAIRKQNYESNMISQAGWSIYQKANYVKIVLISVTIGRKRIALHLYKSSIYII